MGVEYSVWGDVSGRISLFSPMWWEEGDPRLVLVTFLLFPLRNDPQLGEEKLSGKTVF